MQGLYDNRCQHRRHVLDRSDDTAPTRKHELHHSDQEAVRPGGSKLQVDDLFDDVCKQITAGLHN